MLRLSLLRRPAARANVDGQLARKRTVNGSREGSPRHGVPRALRLQRQLRLRGPLLTRLAEPPLQTRVIETLIRLGSKEITRCRRRVSSSSLNCLRQCVLYRLLERQSMAFLPSAVEGSVIAQDRACRGHGPVVAGPFIWRQRRSGLLQSLRRAPEPVVAGPVIWRQRRSNLFPQSLRGAPDAGGAKGSAESSDR